MKLLKCIVILSAAALLAAPAWAGNIPEFDAVDCDALNFFAAANLVQHVPVVNNNVGPYGPVNFYSVFPPEFDNDGNLIDGEYFDNTAGQLFPDPCFPGYMSALTDAWNQGIYEWWIVLQMKPESDINLNIYDCVLKHNEFGLFAPYYGADQTGRYRADWGQLFFVPSANPSVTAEAIPGEYPTPGFAAPFLMDARVLPGLGIVSLDNALYTSKAHWDEGIVMVLPETGTTNTAGQPVYNLKQGDRIHVTVSIPFNNTVDVRYGPDNVILKYIGIVGTWYYGDPCETI
jgi:hypothetical protein